MSHTLMCIIIIQTFSRAQFSHYCSYNNFQNPGRLLPYLVMEDFPGVCMSLQPNLKSMFNNYALSMFALVVIVTW